MANIASIDRWTPHSLAQLSEREFEQAEAVIEFYAERDHARAQWLINCIDAVVEQFGTYELIFVDALDDCPYTHAHTRHWCGRLFCRDS